MFYSWLDEVKCVSNYTGIGRKEIHVGIDPKMKKNISYEDLVNLYGLFKRYKLKNISQLKDIFMNNKNKAWFEPKVIKKKVI